MKVSRLSSLVPTVLAGTTASAAEQAPAVPAFGEQLVQVLGGLALVLVLVVVLAWLARRLNSARFAAGARNLRLVGGISLGARERILVVEVGDTQLVVGVAPGRVQTLHVLEQPLQGAAPDETETGENFSRRLAQLMGKRGQG